MFRVKNFLSLTVFVIGVVAGTLLFPCFSFAQNYWRLGNDLFWYASFSFIMPNTSVYLYAETEPNTYKIYFDGNWSTLWSMGIMDMVYDQEANLLPNNFVRDWYTFEWWSTSRTWPVEYLDQAEVKNLTIEDLWTVTLYAQRSGSNVPYTIEYYQENVDWTWYDLVETGAMYGNAGTWIVLTWKMYTWFTLLTWVEISITSGWVVPYYYTRNTYNLTVKDRDNILIDTWVKYWAIIELPADPVWTWNAFSWWDNVPEGGVMPAEDVVITSKWSYGVHTITFDTNGWSEIAPITGDYGEPIIVPPNPTRTGYEFVWWSPNLPDVMPYDDIVVTAIWKEIPKDKWTGRSGRWRSWSSSDTSPSDQQHGTSVDKNRTWSIIFDEKIDLEVYFAYMWARDMWIIDTLWRDSDPDGYIPRWDMAEMVVKFTENVLWRKVPSVIPAKCNWWDAESEWKSPMTKVYAKKACALWVMWIRMQDFMPNKLLDRAEFWTILSRLLWWDKYDVVDATATNFYYRRHLEALNREWIMKKIENPKDKKELRKWAWLMMMRVKH